MSTIPFVLPYVSCGKIHQRKPICSLSMKYLRYEKGSSITIEVCFCFLFEILNKEGWETRPPLICVACIMCLSHVFIPPQWWLLQWAPISGILGSIRYSLLACSGQFHSFDEYLVLFLLIFKSNDHYSILHMQMCYHGICKTFLWNITQNKIAAKTNIHQV